MTPPMLHAAAEDTLTQSASDAVQSARDARRHAVIDFAPLLLITRFFDIKITVILSGHFFYAAICHAPP